MNNRADVLCGQGQMRRRTFRFAALLLTGFMIGCVADPDLAQTASEPADSEPLAAAQTAERPAPPSKEPAAASAEPAAPPAEMPRKTITKMGSAPPVPLLGMSRADIIKHLGQPIFERRDQTALLLRYREGRCILDLFLYPRDQNDLGKAVNYIEARAADGQRIKTRPCINAVRKANAAG